MRLLASLLLLATPAVTVLQDPTPTPTPRTTTKAPESVAKPAANEADGILAGWLLVGSNNEIAMAELALQRAQNPDVKNFAQKMIDEHRQMGQKLQPFASAAGFAGMSSTRTAERDLGSPDSKTPPAQRDADAPDSKAPSSAQGRPVEASSRAAGPGIDHVALIQELGRECLASSRKELEQKSGAEFDRCYMGMMVGAHMKTNDMLTVFQRHSSGQLKSVLADGQKTVAAHLQGAKDLCKKLEGHEKEPVEVGSK